MLTIIACASGKTTYQAIIALLQAHGYNPQKSMGAYTLECEAFRVETESMLTETRSIVQQVLSYAGVFKQIALPWADSPVGVVELTGDELTVRAGSYFSLVAHSPRLQALVDAAYPGRRVKQIARVQLSDAVSDAYAAHTKAIHKALRVYCRETAGELRPAADIYAFLDAALFSCADTSSRQFDAVLQDQIMPTLHQLCERQETQEIDWA